MSYLNPQSEEFEMMERATIALERIAHQLMRLADEQCGAVSYEQERENAAGERERFSTRDEP